jgi:hypothetical protein
MRHLLALGLIVAAVTFARPANAALVGHWDFNEPSGSTVLDSSGNNYHGQLFGNAQRSTDAPVGPNGADFGTSLRLNGHVEITGTGSGPHPLTLAGSPYTIAFWIKYQSGNRFIQMDDGNDAAGGYSMRTSNGTELFVSHLNNGVGYNASTGMSLGGGEWTHFAIVYDGTKLTGYRNGVLAWNGPNVAPLASEDDDPLWFGGIPVHGQYMTGWLDDIRIYNHALSQYEVLGLMYLPEPATALLPLIGGLLAMCRRQRAWKGHSNA